MKEYKRQMLKSEYFSELKMSLSDYYNYIFWEDMDDFELSHYDCGDTDCWCQIYYEYEEEIESFQIGKRRYSPLRKIDMESFRDKVWKRNKKIDEILNTELDEN